MTDTPKTAGKRVEYPSGLFAPGEYAKGPDGVWYANTPNDHLANLAAHTVEEHDDGTISVSPSILVSGSGGVHQWHGFLERGVWREV